MDFSSITALVDACAWDTTSYLVISENVFDPFIYYSHLLPLIASVLIGYFIFFKSPKLLVNQILFVITNLFAVWVFFDLILWATDKPHYTIFFWSLVNIIEPFIYAFSVYFIQAFISGKDTSVKNKLALFLPLLPVLILGFSSFNLLGFNLSNCDREAIEGPLAHYIYLIELFYVLWIALHSIRQFAFYAKQKRTQILLVSISILCFLLAFSWGNIVGSLTDSWRVPQWGLFGMPVFIAALAYLIIRYNAFNIKVISTEILVTAFPILVGSQYFLAQSFGNRVITIITFTLSIISGILIVISVKREVSQREHIEKLASDLKKANVRLTELDRQKSEFVSFATHQLRSPLAAMKGYASLILEGDMGALPKEAHDAVSRIYDSTNTLTAIVDDYLNIARIELGSMKYAFDTVDLKILVEDVIAELKPNIDRASAVKFSFDAENSGTDYRITADRDKLKQVVTNLIDNSLKYTPQGSVTVSLGVDRAKHRFVFKVSDTGIGIAPETLPHLFNKWSRAKNANKTNIKGTGLGLFVAKEILSAHHGTIRAESSGEGKGSTFTVELEPFAKA